MSDEELSKKIKTIKTGLSSIKSAKDNKVESFANLLKEIFEIKPESGKVQEEHYLTIAAMIEFCFDQKLISVVTLLKDEEICELNKFFFTTYDRISKKQEVLSLKSTKLFPLHQDLIAKANIGMMHRSLFTIQKENKKGKKGD